MQKGKGVRQSTINFCILGIFFLIVLMLIGDEIFMTRSISAEQTAEIRRAEFKQLGEDLASASDYLTNEAREFAVTGNMQHMYNYWKEIDVTRTRDIVIEQLKKSDPSPIEQQLLANAKKHSDDLTETERRSMRLLLEAKGYTQDNITQKEVAEYKLSAQDESLSNAEKLETARDIMFDDNYQTAKNNIMAPIATFKNVMNVRLNKEMAAAQESTERAAVLQMVLSVIVIFAIAVILRLFFRQVTSPIQDYAQRLHTFNINNENFRLKPLGTQEIRMLAGNFNELYDSVQNEIHLRRKAELTMREAKEEAERANNAKSEFLASMSHEIRTPINAIIGYGYMLKGSSLNSQQENYAERINLSAKNLLSIVNDILDFTKIEAGKLSLEQIPVDLFKILNDCCAILEVEAIRKGLYMHLEIEKEVPQFVLGDSTRLRQVLLNLLGNAVKFTSKGGVTLRVSEEKKEAEKTHLHFSIIDTGIGITGEQKSRLFEAFSQGDASTTRKYGGTGLGLAISKRIIKQMGGVITVDSTPGKGSNFQFFIPMQKTDINPEKEAEADMIAVRSRLKGLRVLLTEDNDINREMTCEILSNTGIIVDTASGGAQAAEKALKNNYDVIFMDIRMPVVDGYEATRRIRAAEKKHTPIVALSADAVEGVKQKVLDAGMDIYLTKPLDPGKIFSAVSSLFFESAPENGAKPQTVPENTNHGVFDVDTALGRLGGSYSTYCRILSKFIDGSRDTEKKLKQCLGSGDRAGARRIVHDLKGIAGYLGSGALMKEAEKAIEKLDGGEDFSCGPLCDVLAVTVGEAKSVFERLCKKTEREGSGADPVRSVSIRKLSDMFENGYVEAQMVYRQKHEEIKTLLGGADLKPLDDAVDNFCFHEASNLLNQFYEEYEGNNNVQGT